MDNEDPSSKAKRKVLTEARVNQDSTQEVARFPWIAGDPDPSIAPDPRRDQLFPLLRKTHARVVRVEAGEALFIPATYLHKVTHAHNAGATVAVNYWYDVHNPAVENYFSFMAHADRYFRHVTQITLLPETSDEEG